MLGPCAVGGLSRDGTAPPIDRRDAVRGLAPRRTRRELPRIIAAMLLAIDIGNTNVTIGLLRNGALVATRRAATIAARHRRRARAAARRPAAPRRRARSATSTRSPARRSSRRSPRTSRRSPHARERPLTVAAAGIVPLAVRTDRPDEVGADRLVNALAAGRLYGTPAVVVDFGTATTFDCVAADGAYVGGAIAPGSSSGSRRWRHGPPSCRGSSCARPTARSAATPSARCSRARCSAIRRSSPDSCVRIRRELADQAGVSPTRGPRDPDRRAVRARRGRATSRASTRSTPT